MHQLHDKKIGIWGLGIVGKSAIPLVQKYTPHIQLLDKNIEQQLPYPIIVQTPQTIQDFLEYNDFIIPSPGIPLNQYQRYQHKFLTELDLIAQLHTKPTIAITGTVGKTTVTSLINQCIPNSIAMGNIGTPMLEIVTSPKDHDYAVLELSSAQLQHSKYFAPDIAVLTNFFANHLDYHQSVDEYLRAKSNIFAHQTEKQRALIPTNMIDVIAKQVNIPSQIYLFDTEKPKNTVSHPVFYLDKNNLMLMQNSKEYIVYHDMHTLPDITFASNWIVILATLHLAQIDLSNIDFSQLTPQQHRIEFVKNIGHTAVYNDSKSTIWQSTKSAIEKFPQKKLALILGGLSKGIDRSPLMPHLQNSLITVFIFGNEASELGAMCQKYQVQHIVCQSLQEAIEKTFNQQQNFEVLLFSPSGSSFDMFKNYQDRGNYFKELISEL